MRGIEEKHIQRNTALYKKELIKLGYNDNSLLVLLVCICVWCYEIENHHEKKPGHICVLYVWSKMLSSSLDT